MRTLLIMLVAALLASCGGTPEHPAQAGAEGTTKVSMVLNWWPEAEHGGFYAALVHGYYAEEGIEMEILPGGLDIPVIPRVATGRVTFGVTNADDLLLGRAEGADAVALMAPIQRSPRVIIVHADSGIEDFGGLRDMTLAVSSKAAFGMILRQRAPLENVRFVDYTGNPAAFLTRKDYGIQGYSFSEPYVIRQQGGDPHMLEMAELGYNPYTSILAVSGSYLDENRDVVERVVRASVRGWEKYLAEPGETNVYINQRNPEMGLPILEFGVEAIRPLIYIEGPGQPAMGTMTLKRWQAMLDELVGVGLVNAGAVNAADAFTTEFLP